MKLKAFTTGAGVIVQTMGAFFIMAVLQLCGVINWSWWIITAPLWATFGVIFITVIAVLLNLRNERD